MNQQISQWHSSLWFFTLAILLMASSAFAAPVKITVGKQGLSVPLPAGFVDTATAAPQLRQISERNFTAPGSRLLVYAVEQAGLERMKQNQGVPIKRYLSVQVLKQIEGSSATPADFIELKKLLVQQNTALGKAENHLADTGKGKFAALVEEKAKIAQPGFPLTLGVARDDDRVFSTLHLSKFETRAGKTGSVTVLSSANYVLLKDKLIYFYLYADFDKGEDAQWLKETTQTWVESVLRAN